MDNKPLLDSKTTNSNPNLLMRANQITKLTMNNAQCPGVSYYTLVPRAIGATLYAFNTSTVSTNSSADDRPATKQQQQRSI